jgi:hypothetical protein
MLVGILAKSLYFATMTVVYATGGIQPAQLAAVTPDLVLAVFFAVSFVKTPRFWPASALTTAQVAP